MASNKFVIVDNLDTDSGFNIDQSASKIKLNIKDSFKFTDGALDINTDKALPGSLKDITLEGTVLKAKLEGKDDKTLDLSEFSNVKHTDSNTVTITGNGATGTELNAEVKIDVAPENILTSSTAGLKVALETEDLTDAFGNVIGKILRNS